MKLCFSFLALLAFTVSASAQQVTSNQLYRVTPEFPKYVTAHVEFRDPTGARWPSFFYGKPATNGLVQLNAAQPAAMFRLDCNQRPQTNGDQSRRVLGEIFDGSKKGGVGLVINGMGPIKAGLEKAGTLSTTLIGILDVAGKRIPVNAPATLRPQTGGKGDEKNESLMIDLGFEVRAGDLGLKNIDASAPILVRAAVTAYSEAAVAAAAARKR